MKPGDKIKIKPFDAIHAQKDEIQTIMASNGFQANRLFFNTQMKTYCGTVVTLKSQVSRKGAWRVEENGCYWHVEWFDPPCFFSEEDFEI